MALSKGNNTTQFLSTFLLEFHGLENEVQVREWVKATVQSLHQMLRTGSINEDILVTVQIVGDFGYSWGHIIETFTPQMQQLINKDPAQVSKLRAVFLKVHSIYYRMHKDLNFHYSIGTRKLNLKLI